MKKTILYSFSMLLAVSLGLTACDDPYANQPVAEPTVNEQEALQEINFKVDVNKDISPLKITKEQLTTDSIALLTFTTLPTFEEESVKLQHILQLSKTDDFAEPQVFPFSYDEKQGGTIKVSAADLNVFLLAQNKEEVAREFYVRLLSYVVSGGTKLAIKSDNPMAITATPYVKPLKPYHEVTPIPYYIIGMANGGWNNSVDGLGVSIYPLSLVDGDMYTVNGTGIFSFTGYFWQSRSFKLIRDLGNWDEQWGEKDGAFVHNDGGSGNIQVAADGYYTITLDTENNEMTMEAATTTPTDHNGKGIGLIGSFTGWGSDIVMQPAESSHNHIWYVTHTFSEDCEGKFREINDWGVNWGGAHFPMGISAPNGPNIPIKAGTYVIIFNDITGTYYFIEK